MKNQKQIKMNEQPRVLLQRREKAMAKKANWEDLLRAAYKYALPNRNPYMTASPGSNLNWDVYEGTLVLGLRKFVNRMINALVPPDVDWVNLTSGSLIPDEEVEEVNRILQNTTDTLFFYLRQSNFDLVIHEAMTDMAISTGVMQINEGPEDDPIIFSAIPSNQVAFATGPRGDIDAFFRDWHAVDEDHIHSLWGDSFRMPSGISRQDDENLKLDLYEISYYDYNEKLYKYFVIEKSTSEIVVERAEESWEWVGFRWAKLAGEDAGRGPVLDAFPTAATINKAIELEFKSGALKAAPPLMAYTDALLNPWTLTVEPNSVIPIKQIGTATWPIAPLPVGGDIQFISVVVNDLRAQINEIMMAQPLQPLQNGPVRTATEVATVQNELRENAGAQFSRVQKELFDPLVKRVLWILKKKGLIEPIVVDGREVALSYKTPLSVSKDQNDLQKFLQSFEVMSGMFTPGVAIGLVDAPKLPRWIAGKLGAELDLIKDEGDVLQLIQQAQEQALEASEQQQPGQPQAAPQPSGGLF